MLVIAGSAVHIIVNGLKTQTQRRHYEQSLAQGFRFGAVQNLPL